ncbi:hypothetical protein EJ08DRAFT_701591 [Tothia fuscella]|uniref:Uncharacterized protein n=1 Tax=Tothia fuscella TaxID=1048955 RepID=A0A9P4NIM9_9PEZI|nr:hypothetical protein EJ08DRAFT_701591 [Tothia fuscella]
MATRPGQQQPQGAQIPLENFELPQFPAQARGLLALTLTSTIKLEEYPSLLEKPFVVPALPSSIQSLTLELFPLGYPPGFLVRLIDELPDLKSLVVYNQLICGTTPASQVDAVEFFEKALGLRSLHLLDVYAPPPFWDRVAVGFRARERGLMFLEVNYSSRHEDEGMLTRIACDELPLLVTPSLISCSFNVSVPDPTADKTSNLKQGEASIEGPSKGVIAFDTSKSSVLVQALTDEETYPRALKALNTTLYTLKLPQLRTLLAKHKGLMVLNATLELEPTTAFKAELLGMIMLCSSLEQVEIVGSPTEEFHRAAITNDKLLQDASPSQEDIVILAKKCEKLTSFKVNLLRATRWPSIEWKKHGEQWEGGVTLQMEPAESAREVKGSKKKSEAWSPWT